jgi:hypothetical protein
VFARAKIKEPSAIGEIFAMPRRPIRPDLSGLMQAAVQMDVAEMSFERR